MPPRSHDAPPPALTAFLKGVERRGAVVAELLAGAAGDEALARALAAFGARAADLPMADWPRLFWAELLRRLAGAGPVGWPGELPAAASPGMRAALLLRVVAGLDEPDAARVLDVPPAQIRHAMERVVPRQADGSPDAATWARQRQALLARVRELPAARTAGLARLREAALSHDPGPVARPRRRAPLIAVAAAVLLALGATFWLERRADDRIERVALAPAGPPASRYSPDAGLVSHPDFALLADPVTEALARDAAFLSWSAAQADAAAAVADPLATLPPPDPLAAVQALEPESTDAQ